MIDKIKKWYIVLMNPPYEGRDGTHLKFLNKLSKLSNKIISIQPATWIMSQSSGGFLKKLYSDCRNILNKYESEITLIDGQKYFEAGINSFLSINYINMLKESKNIIIYSNTGKKEIFKNQSEIISFFDNKYIIEFYNKIKQYIKNKKTLWDISKGTPNNKAFIFKSKIENNPDKNWWCVYVPRDLSVMGHIDPKTGLKKDDYYVYIPKKKEFQKPFKYTEKRSQQYFVVNNEAEGYNAINYLMTDFCRLCCYVSRETCGKFGYQLIPVLNWNKKYSDKELFEMIGMKYDKNEISKVLSDYYNIRENN